MTISSMKKEDIEQIVALEKKCFSIPWSSQSFFEELNNSLAFYFIARDNGKVLGYLGVWQIGDEGHITNIAVDPKYRRQHIASRLLDELLKFATEKELYALTLEVRKSNLSAQNLYSKYGFCTVGERKAYYEDNREDALIMTRFFADTEEGMN